MKKVDFPPPPPPPPPTPHIMTSSSSLLPSPSSLLFSLYLSDCSYLTIRDALLFLLEHRQIDSELRSKGMAEIPPSSREVLDEGDRTNLDLTHQSIPEEEEEKEVEVGSPPSSSSIFISTSHLLSLFYYVSFLFPFSFID